MSEINSTAPWIGPPEDLEELPQLFEQFSQVTAKLTASHEVLLDQVGSLKTELAAKNLRLERKKRLEALGRVAAGVAHEFRNPLGGIRLTVDALIGAGLGEDAEKRLLHIQRAVFHLDHIVRDLLTFTRSDPLSLGDVNIREIVEQSVELAFPDQGGGRCRP